MKKFFYSEVFIKILSVVLSIMLWAYVAILLNPQIEITINDVPLLYSDSEMLTANGLTMTNQQQKSVNLRLKGNRNTLHGVNNKNITAIVDLNGYNIIGSHFVPITIKLPLDGVSVVGKSPENVFVNIDRYATVKKPVILNVTGVPSNGYVADSPSLPQDSVTLSGPESIIKTIDKAVMSIDVSNLQSDFAELKDYTFLSANGVAVESDLIICSPAQLEARCTILKRMTVPVKAELTGTSDGYRVSATIPAYNEITIIGREGDVDKVEYITTKPIDITNLTQNENREAELLMPTGVKTEAAIESINVVLNVEANS